MFKKLKQFRWLEIWSVFISIITLFLSFITLRDQHRFNDLSAKVEEQSTQLAKQNSALTLTDISIKNYTGKITESDHKFSPHDLTCKINYKIKQGKIKNAYVVSVINDSTFNYQTINASNKKTNTLNISIPQLNDNDGYLKCFLVLIDMNNNANVTFFTAAPLSKDNNSNYTFNSQKTLTIKNNQLLDIIYVNGEIQRYNNEFQVKTPFNGKDILNWRNEIVKYLQENGFI